MSHLLRTATPRRSRDKEDPRCMRLNLVFIQFTRIPDGTFTPLPSVTSIPEWVFERVTESFKAQTISRISPDDFQIMTPTF